VKKEERLGRQESVLAEKLKQKMEVMDKNSPYFPTSLKVQRKHTNSVVVPSMNQRIENERSLGQNLIAMGGGESH